MISLESEPPGFPGGSHFGACKYVANPLGRGDRAIHPLAHANDSDVICSAGQVPRRYGEDAMSETLSKALVLTMLQHAEDFPWRM